MTRAACSASIHRFGSTPATFFKTFPLNVSGLVRSTASTTSSQLGHRCTRNALALRGLWATSETTAVPGGALRLQAGLGGRERSGASRAWTRFPRLLE